MSRGPWDAVLSQSTQVCRARGPEICPPILGATLGPGGELLVTVGEEQSLQRERVTGENGSTGDGHCKGTVIAG